MGGINIPITADNRNFVAAANEAQAAVRKTSNEVKGLSKDTNDATAGLKEMLKQAAAFGGISIGVAGVKEFVSSMVSVRKEMQSYSTALSVLLGDQAKANDMFEELKQFAATTPLMFKSLAAGAQTMLGFNIEAEKVVPTLKAIGDISMGDAQKFQSLTLAFSQMSATGKLMGQDLLQMINAGFNPLTEISRKTGKSISELKDEMSKGTISAEMVSDAFMSATQEGGKFYGMLEKQGKGIAGQMNTLSGAVDDMFNSIGEKTEGIITGSIQGLTTLVQNWESIGAAIMVAAEALGTYKAIEMAMTAMDRTAKSASYNAELTALQALMPVKEQATAADLQEAVATGAITQAKADEIAALRAEVEAQIAALTAQEAAAKAKMKSATEAHLIAKRNLAVAQSQVNIALASGNAEEIAAAKRGAAVAKTELQNAAIARNTAAKELNTISTQKHALTEGLDAAAQAGDAAATGVLTYAKLALKAAVDAVNASFLASPLFWIAAVIAGVTYGVYKLITAENDEERARRQASEAWDDFQKKQEGYKKDINDLVRICKDENETLIAQYKAFNKLREIFPDLIKKYGTLKALQQADANEIQAILNQFQEEESRSKILDDVEKAQEKLNKAQQSYNNALAAGINGQALLPYEQNVKEAKAMYDELKRRLDEYLAEENRALAQAAEEARPIEVRIQEAQDNKKRLSEAMSYYNKATEAMQGEITAPNLAPPDIDEILSDIDKKIKDAKDELKKNPFNIEIQEDIKSLEKVRKTIKDAKDEMDRTGLTTIPVKFELEVGNAQEMLTQVTNYVETLEAQANKSQSDSSVHNKAYWENQKKKKQEELDALDDINANGKKGLEIKKEIAEIDKKINAYSVNDGKKGTDKAKQAAEDAKKLNEETERQARETEKRKRQLALDSEQAYIDGMKDGNEKNLRQLKLNFYKEKEQIRQEKEDLKALREDNARKMWEAQNPELVRKNANAWVSSGKQEEFRSNYTISEEEQDLFDRKIKAAIKKYNDAVYQENSKAAKAMNDFLIEYGDYYEQRLAITNKYQKLIEEAENEGDKEKYRAEMRTSLDNVDKKFGKSTSKLQKLWKDVGKASRKEIKSMISDLTKLQKAIQDGKITGDEETLLASLGFTTEDIAKVKSGEMSVEEMINKIKELKGNLEQTSNKFAVFWDAVKSGDMDAIGQSFNQMMNQISGYAEGLNALASVLGDNNIKGALEDVQTIIGEIGTGASVGGSVGGGWGALVGAIIGTVTGIGKAITNHIDDNEIKAIERLDRQINTLKKSYDSLSEAVDKTFSSQKSANINKEIENLARQNDLIKQQIAAEDNKKGRDQSVIDSYQDQIYENQKKIQELKEQAKDAIFGSDINSAIENFAEAYANAWQQNTNRTKTAKEQVRQMMQDMVKESIKAAIESSEAMTKIRTKLQNFFKDGMLSAAEQNEIYREAEALQKELDRRFGWADKLLDENNDFTQSGSSGGFTAMSQESADELNGRFAAGQMSLENILQQEMLIYASQQAMAAVQTEGNETLQEIRNMMINVASNVEDIASYTKHLTTFGVKFDEMNQKLSKL